MTGWLERGSDETGARLVRDILTIVVAGAALGIGVNAVRRAATPGKGLAWVRVEVPLQSLESLQPALDVSSPNPEGATVAEAAASPAPHSSAPQSSAPTPAPAPERSPVRKPSGQNLPAAKPAAQKTTAPKTATTKPAGSAPATAPPAQSTAAAAKTAPPPAAALPVIPDSDQPLDAKLPIVKQLFDAGAAVIVDARGADEYSAGHIRGALNLPFDDVAKDQSLLKRLDVHGKPVVVYCDGGECELSKELAAVLVGVGYRKVLVYSGGLPEWQGAGYPTATGGTQ
jgi:rhodanese-related sulfurtransferase